MDGGLFAGLDAFSDDLYAEVVSEYDHGADELDGMVVVGHPGDEGATDLEVVDGEAVEGAEGGMPGVPSDVRPVRGA